MMKPIMLALAGAMLATVAGAQPFESYAAKSTPVPGTVYVYDTTTTSGSGLVTFNVPLPPNGPYLASFRASFAPLGTTSAPETFVCSLSSNGGVSFAQSTNLSVSNLGTNVGVSAIAPINVNKSTTAIQITCGTADGANWTFGEKVEVALERVASFTNKKLTVVKNEMSNH
jgi:hypothetical protein